MVNHHGIAGGKGLIPRCFGRTLKCRRQGSPWGLKTYREWILNLHSSRTMKQNDKERNNPHKL
jgi:hypothetical protein